MPGMHVACGMVWYTPRSLHWEEADDDEDDDNDDRIAADMVIVVWGNLWRTLTVGVCVCARTYVCVS